jgi:hypothetical protein
MIAITADTLRNIALGGVGASVLLSLVLAMVIKSVVGKLISVAIMAAVALALYTQQDQLKSCADKITNKIEEGVSAAGKSAVCTFFGQDVTFQIPDSLK